ncbi:hypothetical protein [Winogradskyella endarachnes]|uniref:DUF4488 domain-containing protein n=1 Tax=Winogradskyella endarachnes TaxID=2681965 RepID=A0A6L6UC45_9FLAO|nr:hypothetical protein [Winogradskyella endarachnes]MUU79549.1 hypothetical protein [Winogradskyella endarachnes]
MKYIVWLIIPLVFFKSIAQQENIMGRWKGEDKNEIGYINFETEKYASFEIDGKIYGGKEFELKGKKGQMTYIIDFHKSPIEIDFIVTQFESGEYRTLRCIANFLDKDTLQLNISFDDNRPTEFNEDTLTLNRVKSKKNRRP